MQQTRDAIYLDVNAGALLHPEVKSAVMKALNSPEILLGANPSSIHAHGRRAKALITLARTTIAQSLGLSSREASRSLFFTSSGSEANQLAIKSTLAPQKKLHWITTPVEHSCNLKMIQWVKDQGGDVSFLPIDSQGRSNPQDLMSLIRPETALVSVIWVNNETGVINDIEAMARECAKAKIPLHVDGAQAWGKLPIELEKLSDLGVCFAAFAAHKIGGLSGNGVLWAKDAKTVSPVAGTENTLGIHTMGIAAAQIDLSQQAPLASLRDRLQSLITSRIDRVMINGEDAPRVAGTLSLCVDGISRQGLVQSLDLEGFSVSSGSACASGNPEPSHVLTALGRTRDQASNAVRISFNSGLKWSELEKFELALEKVVARLRGVKMIAAADAK